MSGLVGGSSSVPTATHVRESTVVPGTLDRVWDLIKGMKFAWNGVISEVATTPTVGSTIRYDYADNTSQTVQIVELSEVQHFVSYEMLESTPAVSYTSALFKIQVYEVTFGDSPQCFVEWSTDFTNDADATVIVDSRFKKHEGFKALKKHLLALDV